MLSRCSSTTSSLVTSSSVTFSLLFMIFTNFSSDILPVLWRSKDLQERSLIVNVFSSKRKLYRKQSSRESWSGSCLLCMETIFRYSLKETENPYLSAETFLITAFAWKMVSHLPRFMVLISFNLPAVGTGCHGTHQSVRNGFHQE